ncbi:hypothetical protein Pen01_08060 [Phytomonospora endophytica]|nr:hypothetical protein Pen01_08060 [Phytomonospora endophytica]
MRQGGTEDKTDESLLDRAAAMQSRVGNRAFGRYLDASAADRPTVQRRVFIAGVRVHAPDPRLNAITTPWAGDGLMRDYHDVAEMNAHAAGTTDHIGNLPGPPSADTWVRFPRTGLNILGEDHTQVKFEMVAPAIGTTNFTYEPFSSDRLPAGSQISAAYNTENNAGYAAFGVGAAPNRRRFGGESLYPKMAFAMNLLIPYFNGTSALAGLATGGYVGEPTQRYLKISWAFAKDVVAEVAGRRRWQRALSAEKRNLAAVTTAQMATLDAWITGLVVDGHLGDTLDTVAHRPKLPNLLAFVNALLPVLNARAGSDAGLNWRERRRLRRMPSATEADRASKFALWRNLHFKHVVADAARRGVRYAGMGRAHMDYLVTDHAVPRGARTFDMTGADLAGFEGRTAHLATLP